MNWMRKNAGRCLQWHSHSGRINMMLYGWSHWWRCICFHHRPSLNAAVSEAQHFSDAGEVDASPQVPHSWHPQNELLTHLLLSGSVFSLRLARAAQLVFGPGSRKPRRSNHYRERKRGREEEELEWAFQVINTLTNEQKTNITEVLIIQPNIFIARSSCSPHTSFLFTPSRNWCKTQVKRPIGRLYLWQYCSYPSPYTCMCDIQWLPSGDLNAHDLSLSICKPSSAVGELLALTCTMKLQR